jgi:hypothetical protein
LTTYQKEKEILQLYLKEVIYITKEYLNSKLSSKGFFEQITVQDFPIRGHQVYLHITTQRWLNKNPSQVVFSPDSYREKFSGRRNSSKTRVRIFFKINQ